MHGISPKNYAPSLQQQASREISETVPEFPTSLSDLISQMAVPDFSVAAQPLELDDTGEVIQNEKNRDIIATIELALTSSSTECDPAIKTAIFSNAQNLDLSAQNPDEFNCMLRPYLIRIINALTDSGQQINLDDVNLSDLDLAVSEGRLNLSGMSAKRAVFDNVNMKNIGMERADLTGAKIGDCTLHDVNWNNVDITDATLSDMYFIDTQVYGLTGNQSALFKACVTVSDPTDLENCEKFWLEGPCLKLICLKAIPDRPTFTLPHE